MADQSSVGGPGCWSGPDCYLYFCVVWMFQAGMKRDFLSSPSFGSGIVRKGIYLMGVFLHSSEHWLVVMASVMTEILWSTQISISTVWFHQITLQAPSLSSHHQDLYFPPQNRTRQSPPFIKVKFTPKNCVVFLNLGQKGANENLLCFNYVFFWPSDVPWLAVRRTADTVLKGWY